MTKAIDQEIKHFNKRAPGVIKVSKAKTQGVNVVETEFGDGSKRVLLVNQKQAKENGVYTLVCEETNIDRSKMDPSSFAYALSMLEVGEHLSRTELVPFPRNQMASTSNPNIREMRDALVNNVGSSIRNVSKKTGYAFSVESTEFLTNNSRIYVVAIVTRVR